MEAKRAKEDRRLNGEEGLVSIGVSSSLSTSSFCIRKQNCIVKVKGRWCRSVTSRYGPLGAKGPPLVGEEVRKEVGS